MFSTIKIGIWNANGLIQRSQELKTFLIEHDIDIMLISETHFTKKSYLKIPRYNIYDTQHPDGTAHGGTAIIIKTTIKHHENEGYKKEHLQATSITVEDWTGTLTVASIYSPPKHMIKQEQYWHFFKTLGHRFIAGGDYNAKHPWWGSRSNIPTPKGRQLYQTILENNLQVITSGEPTYWPSDRRKIPDVIDFCVTKGISEHHTKIESCLDLTSDHSPLKVTISTQIIKKEKPPTLYNKKTNWNLFSEIISEQITCNIPLKTNEELEIAIDNFNTIIQKTAWATTPKIETPEAKTVCSTSVKNKIAEKRKLRKEWQKTRSPHDKAKLNKATKQLKLLIHNEKNKSIEDYLKNLTATEATDYSLWKATRKIKNPQQPIPPIRTSDGNWAKSSKDKAKLFAEHLTKVFTPLPQEASKNEEDVINHYLKAPLQMEMPIKKITTKEVYNIMQKDLNAKKAPGYDLITGKILKELPDKALRLLTIIYNAILRLNYYPTQWKVAQIILLPKPGKNTEEVTSYRPISLLPVLSKVFEKLLVKRIKPELEKNKIVPDHQFGFREQHSTIEQVHRIVRKINNDLEEKRYCSAIFLDISQAFDKVWHSGLLYKIKKYLPHKFYLLLKSYITDRYFLVKHQEEYTELIPIRSGVPQGSVLGPVLYLIYTMDLPTTRQTLTATYADDTTIMASHTDPKIASRNLQDNINQVEQWLKTWRIKVNEQKSVHVTFTTKREICPPVKINNKQIPQTKTAKYLGMHLDSRLTWKIHIWNKRKQLGYKLSKMYWLLNRKSKLSLDNKVLLYKSMIKPIWTYGIQLWGSTANSNIEILERFQSKLLRIIVDAPWYVTNEIIRRDLHIPTIKEEINNYCKAYINRLDNHPNKLANRLLKENSDKRRLKRFKPLDAQIRFK